MTTPDPDVPPVSIPLASHSRAARTRVLALIALWAVAVAVGWAMLHAYQAKAGPSEAAVAVWPASAPFARAADKPTLLLVAHPDCPCTLATLDELARITESKSMKGKVDLHVLFYMDPEFEAEWRHGSAFGKAAALGATLHEDPFGKFARVLGTQTSGHVLLFAADGHRLFSGGITPSRGERGDSVGADAILQVVRTGTAVRSKSSVFGCLLWGDDDVKGAS